MNRGFGICVAFKKVRSFHNRGKILFSVTKRSKFLKHLSQNYITSRHKNLQHFSSFCQPSGGNPIRKNISLKKVKLFLNYLIVHSLLQHSWNCNLFIILIEVMQRQRIYVFLWHIFIGLPPEPSAPSLVWCIGKSRVFLILT